MPAGINRTKLPIRDAPFKGARGRTLKDSKPDWAITASVRPPEGAPNVLLVLIDDAGFGNPSTFGGPVADADADALADGGLSYNRFHVTALCSPTRAALLSGRNHHAVGFGSVAESPAACPATRPPGRRRAPFPPGSCRATATAPRPSASGT